MAITALSRDKTLAELSAEFGGHPTMSARWERELVKRAGELFARGNNAPPVENVQKIIVGRARAVPAMINRLRVGD